MKTTTASLLRRARWAAPLLVAALLAACATPRSLTPGTPKDQVVAKYGAPTFEYPRADGARRLEYWGGMWGRHTWMIDLDAQGRFVAADQVRDEAHFGALRIGMTADEVLAAVGHPSQVDWLPRQRHRLWSYRYDNPFCMWYQVSVAEDGKVAELGDGHDPRCDIEDR